MRFAYLSIYTRHNIYLKIYRAPRLVPVFLSLALLNFSLQKETSLFKTQSVNQEYSNEPLQF